MNIIKQLQFHIDKTDFYDGLINIIFKKSENIDDARDNYLVQAIPTKENECGYWCNNNTLRFIIIPDGVRRNR